MLGAWIENGVELLSTRVRRSVRGTEGGSELRYVFDEKLNETPTAAFLAHLAEINKIVLSSETRLFGNLFYGGWAHPDLSPDQVANAKRPVAENKVIPPMREKRYNLTLAVTGKSLLLEVGFNAGHSALLALEANPRLSYIGIDIAFPKYTRPCADYMKSVYGERFDLLYGSSLDLLPKFADDPRAWHVDLVHIDGAHTERIANADMQNTLALPAAPGLCRHMLADDTNDPMLRGLVISLINSRRVLGETYGGLWKGASNMCIRIITDKLEAA